MRNVPIPISNRLNTACKRVRQKRPCTLPNTGKHWHCIEVSLLHGERRRKFHLFVFHAMAFPLLALLLAMATSMVQLAASFLLHTFFRTAIHLRHHLHSHLHCTRSKTVHKGCAHTQEHYHEREQRYEQYVERTFHGRKINTFLSDNSL